jgi:phosphoribosylamine---glycine ligase
MKKSVLIIGSGGREHAIGWKLAQASDIGTIYFAPGNAGTASIGKNISIDPTNIQKLLTFAKKNHVFLTIVGTEVALEAGIVDKFARAGLTVFGPTQKAAKLETSKVWATEFMKRHHLPCPRSEVFKNIDYALAYAEQLDGKCVVKADGLCQGKGVYVCNSVDEAKKALWAIMVEKVFGKAGAQVVIQEKLVGWEVSMMAFCDGTRAIPLVAASDYKRIFDGDRGLNTGGMGAIAPVSLPAVVQKKIYSLLTKTVASMKKEGMPYKGILYAGIMMVGNTPYILEYNCRFGDPETQVQLPLLSGDLLAILTAAVKGRLTHGLVGWKRKHAVCVVAAAKGYPGAYSNGKTIQGVGNVFEHGAMVFHAGTVLENNQVKTNGGRVLAVVATGASRSQARTIAYNNIKKISFSGIQFRKDIGKNK